MKEEPSAPRAPGGCCPAAGRGLGWGWGGSGRRQPSSAGPPLPALARGRRVEHPWPEVPCIFPRLWLRGWRPVSRLRVSGEGAGPGSAPHPAASFPSRAVTSPQQGEGVRHLLNHFTINGSFAGENIPPSITRSDLPSDRPGRVWCRLPQLTRGHSADAASRARVYFRTGTSGARTRPGPELEPGVSAPGILGLGWRWQEGPRAGGMLLQPPGSSTCGLYPC